MTLHPTPLTAALAGAFSGLTWPLLWPFFNGPTAPSTLWLVLATLALIALPAHAFVLGFSRSQTVVAGAVDSALLIRIGAWVAAAAVTALLVAAWRGSA